MSSAAGMKRAGRKGGFIFSVWIGIALTSGVAAYCGYTIFGEFSPAVIEATIAGGRYTKYVKQRYDTGSF